MQIDYEALDYLLPPDSEVTAAVNRETWQTYIAYTTGHDKSDGSGMEPGSSKRACATCGGHGQIEYRQQSLLGSFVNVRACPECHGAGEVVEQPCHRCHGNARGK